MNALRPDHEIVGFGRWARSARLLMPGPNTQKTEKKIDGPGMKVQAHAQ